MVFFRNFVVITAIYSIVSSKQAKTDVLKHNLIKVLALIYINLSTFFISSHFCLTLSYHERNPHSYMRYLLYHQSQYCDQTVNWEFAGVENFSSIQPVRPEKRWIVTRTFIIAILNLVVCVLILIGSVIALSKEILRTFLFCNLKHSL